MMTGILFIVTLAAALGSGLISGLFFAFSVSVMNALSRLPSAQGIAAMQHINVVILNPVFLAVFLGTAVLSVILIIVSFLRWENPAAVYLLIGGVLYFTGSFLVTMIFNVPKNNALAAIAPASSEGEKLWTDYLSQWTAWNHVRTVASLAAAAFLTLALRQGI